VGALVHTRVPSATLSHHVSLDKAVMTVRETNAGMKEKHEETARVGLALNIVEC
jgi:L-serine dehydratase